MKSANAKIYGKINLSLNINGVNNDYHMLDSVVTTVSVYDIVKVKERKDDKILITFSGKYQTVFKDQSKTNAYKTAVKFMEKYGKKGLDIEIIRNIKDGGGLGSSSADIVGVLLALKKLYGVSESVKPIADSMGSDPGYLLNGGYARITSRGEVVSPFECKNKYYFVILYADSGVSTKECFELFDKSNTIGNLSNNDELINDLISGDIDKISKNINNALKDSAVILNAQIKENINEIQSLSPKIVSMTGSGSTVFAMYENYEFASWAHDKLAKKHGEKVQLLTTVNPKEFSLIDFLCGYTTCENTK